MPRAASEDSGSANGRCVTPRRPPTPRRRRTHQPSHHTRTARWPAGTLRPAAPTSPCPFRIMAPQAPVRPGRSRGSQDSGPAPNACACSRGSHPPAAANCERDSRPRPRPGPSPNGQHWRPMVCVAGPSPSRVNSQGVSCRNPSGPVSKGSRLVRQASPHALSIPRDWIIYLWFFFFFIQGFSM